MDKWKRNMVRSGKLQLKKNTSEKKNVGYSKDAEFPEASKNYNINMGDEEKVEWYFSCFG